MPQTFSRVLPLLSGFSLLILASGCTGDPEPRRYSEIDPPSREGETRLLQRDAKAPMTWTLPEGWSEQPEGDPMRLTGFWAPDPAYATRGETDPKPVDVSLVQLAGDAGGLEANVTRWLGQVKIPPSYASQAIAEATPVRLASGEEGIIVDFTGFLSGDLTQSQSIVGAIVTAGETTVFVKAIGPRESVMNIKSQLVAFCRGLAIRGTEGGTP